MNLVLFTTHFPYVGGEIFLLNEYLVANEFFDKIVIVTLDKKGKERVVDISEKTEVISLREQYTFIKRSLSFVTIVFSYQFWQEVFYGISQRGITAIAGIVKNTLLEGDAIRLIKRNSKKWVQEEQSVYYSYWLDACATSISELSEELNGVCISRAHGGDVFFDRGFHPFRKEQLGGLDYIFSISEAGRNDLLRINSTKVEGLENKVFVARLGTVIKNDFPAWQRSEKRTVVSCSSIIELKRIDIIIGALEILEDIKVEWIHIGSGNLASDIIELAAEKLAGKKNIRYEFVGQKSQEEIYDFYSKKQVDVFVNASDSEGVPVSIMEAMSFGIPAIARNVGGNGEIVNNETGLLLSQEANSEDFARALRAIFSLTNEEYLAKRSKARKMILDNYDAVKNYHNFYENIVTK